MLRCHGCLTLRRGSAAVTSPACEGGPPEGGRDVPREGGLSAPPLIGQPAAGRPCL